MDVNIDDSTMGISIRPTGMASAAAALRYWERRQEVAANNIANVSTGGFKGERVFARLVENGLPAPDTATDFTPGALTTTGNPLDVGIEGPGFFVAQTANGERLTRGGTLRIDEQGFLVDSAGNALLGDRGLVRVTSRGNTAPTKLEITRDGLVRADGADVSRLRLETVAPGTPLAREGNGLFIPPASAARTRLGDETRIVRQGELEDSNVTPVGEMVDMISIQRAYTAVQKALGTLDAARGIATTELGRPVN